jgi:hypothetical protein
LRVIKAKPLSIQVDKPPNLRVAVRRVDHLVVTGIIVVKPGGVKLLAGEEFIRA